ncbi:MAG: hypothetical protein CME65_02055 [Halobacteriovoraceae bacterium]|nr:hypothetical protein [Halobacteriovoraceae bacterium]|tara:strand:- start:1268 stop:2293 length:1026 start_codon:yes stop_codon:yes gene_type:complete
MQGELFRVKTFFFVVLIFSFQALSAPKINKVKDSLVNYQNKLNKMEAELNQIDKELSQYNMDFLEDQGKLKDVESQLESQRKSLNETAGKISEKFQLAKKAYLNYLMEAQDTENSNKIFHEKIYHEILKKKLQALTKAQDKSRNILSNINKYESRIKDFREQEDSIYQYIINLENKKKTVGQNYIDTMEKRNALQAELDKLLAKQKAYKKVKRVAQGGHGDFGLPLKGFQSLKKGKKGLTLKYTGTQPVLAPAVGRVVYVGELASYGQVIMIDHGNEIKSVLLGDMKVKTKKGEAVKLNQILGYTVSDEEVAKSLYFEVRKKNKVEDTAKWIAPAYQKRIL